MSKYVFLVGAGFSRAVSDAAKVPEDLRMPVGGELGNLIRKSNVGPDLPKSITSLGDNVEAWMTYLSRSQPWLLRHYDVFNQSLFMRIAQIIRNEIDRRVKACTEKTLPSWFRRLVEFWIDNEVSVITLNYDTLIERALVSLSDPNPREHEAGNLYPAPLTPAESRVGGHTEEAFGKPPFEMFKLHGSTNWWYSNTISTDPVYFNQVRWGKDHEKQSHQEQHVADLVPFIIPPVFEKGSYFDHEILRLIWREAGERIRAASHMFVLGYSLPPADTTMRTFLSVSCGLPKPLLVVDKTKRVAVNYRRLNGNYAIQGPCYGDDAVEQFVEKLIAGDLE